MDRTDKVQTKASIQAYLQTQEAAFVEDLAKIVAIDSVSGPALPGKPYGEGTAQVLDTFLTIAKGYGFHTENRENQVGVVTLGDPKSRRLDILAHLDVVPAGDGWTKTDPFVLKREGDRVYGRGTIDDKGPALAALYALRAIKDLDIPLAEGVRLVVGCDEECGSNDMKYYYEREPYAEMTFTPDGSFPLINIEKGRYSGRITWEAAAEQGEANQAGTELAEDGQAPAGASDACVQILTIQGGTVSNAVPAVCTAQVRGMDVAAAAPFVAALETQTGTTVEILEKEGGLLQLTVRGTSAHASTPDGGNNAVTAMLQLLASLPLAESPLTHRLRALARIFPHGDCHGRAAGIYMADQESGEITVSLDILRYEDGKLEAACDSRTPLCATAEGLAPIEEKLRAGGLVSHLTMRPPHHVPGDSRLVKTLLDCYEAVTGKPGACLAIGGGTYVHDVPGGVAFGCEVAEVDNHMHGVDEFAELSLLRDSSTMFALAIAELCGA